VPTGSGSGQSLVARCSRLPEETLPQSSTVCAAETVTFRRSPPLAGRY
jgi:hypothetical protein